LADLQRTVYPHNGHPLAEGQAQDRVSLPAKDRRSANCATQPTAAIENLPLQVAANDFYRHVLYVKTYEYIYNFINKME